MPPTLAKLLKSQALVDLLTPLYNTTTGALKLSSAQVDALAALSAAEGGVLDGVTPGTILASKAAVVDANKDIADFRNLSGTNLKAGKDAVAGTVTIFPTTTAKGKAVFDVTDQTGDTQVTHRTAAMGQATVITTPDPGAAAASVVLTEGAQTINGNKTFGGSIIRTGQEWQAAGPAKVGTTAGWVVQPASNLYEATLPQSQTGSTLVVPVRGLKVGWTITGFKVVLQIESAGNTVTVDADLRKLTNAAGDPVDASVGTITQVSVTADTAVAATKTGLSDAVAADEWFYILITATTGATTDIRYLGCTVTVTEA